MIMEKGYINFPISYLSDIRYDNVARSIDTDSVVRVLNKAFQYGFYTVYWSRLPYNHTSDKWHEKTKEYVEDLVGVIKHEDQPNTAFKNKKPGANVIVGVKSHTLFLFRDGIDRKTEFHIIQLLAFLAIKSILGIGKNQPKAKQIKWDYIYNRMAGRESIKKTRLPPYIEKYRTRRLRTKLVKALQDHWNLKYYATQLGKFNPPWFSFANDFDIVEFAEKWKEDKRAKKQKK